MRALLPRAPPQLTRRAARYRAVAPRMAASGAVVPAWRDKSAFRVLAFEDNHDIGALLRDAGVEYAHLEQRWTTTCVRREGTPCAASSP